MQPSTAADDSVLLHRRLLELFFPGRGDCEEARAELASKLRQAADEIHPIEGSVANRQSDDGLAGSSAKHCGREAATQNRGEAAGAEPPEAVPVAGDQPEPIHHHRITKKQRKGKGNREFDFRKYEQRHVALEVLYLGWDYHGFAAVDNSDNTIEAHLFRALEKTRLIPEGADRAELKYSRCGRTDKGVSALGQVVALLLRSSSTRAPAEQLEGGGPGGGCCLCPLEQELDYPSILNRALPPEIRVLGWAPVQPTFNARFDALHREYKYFIVAPGHGADTVAMQEAAQHFVGLHDFRHFCKLDAANVNSFVRRIEFFHVRAVEGCAWAGGRQLFELNLRGSAFLWHQVRCMAAVLMMVGRGLEPPSVVARYLDVSAEPRKPQYAMASEDPLLLYGCGFDWGSGGFRRSPAVQAANSDAVERMLDEQLVRAGLLWSVAERLQRDTNTGESTGAVAAPERKRAAHIPLHLRAKEPTVEERMARYGRVPVGLGEHSGAAGGGECQEIAAVERGGGPALQQL